jgi:hypothetical protein
MNYIELHKKFVDADNAIIDKGSSVNTIDRVSVNELRLVNALNTISELLIMLSKTSTPKSKWITIDTRKSKQDK